MIRRIVICTTDHTDVDLHNDQHTLIVKFLHMGTFEIKVKIKIIQYVSMCKHITLQRSKML